MPSNGALLQLKMNWKCVKKGDHVESLKYGNFQILCRQLREGTGDKHKKPKSDIWHLKFSLK
jgi:hypothetical protein